jgi:4-amino-4-deoxy-L-arabinose transferase-like glycosyltransferase
MTKLPALLHRFTSSDRWLALSLTVLGLLTRLPYFMQIPYFEDETLEALYALKVYPGGQFVASTWDNYLGPQSAYLVALGYRLFGLDPIVPRALVVIMGALTVGLTYLLARTLGLNKFGSFVAALILLANPFHILINSHIAWSNSMLAFYITTTLLSMALAIKRDQPRWLLLTGLLGGLALQAHPSLLIMLPGILLWSLIESNGRQFMRTRWPYIGALIAALVYSVVIINNLQVSLYGVAEAQARSYIWQTNPTLSTTIENFGRLTLQLFRIISGQLEGPEDFSVLIGLPLIYAAWLIAALIYTARKRLWLPLVIVASVWIIMPVLSNHYGTIITTRLTNHLTPLIAIMLAFAAEASIRLVTQRRLKLVASIVLIAAALYPIVPLIGYYQARVAAGKTNDEFFGLNDQIKAIDQNSPVYLSTSLSDLRLGGSGNVGYVFDYFLGLDQIPHETLPPTQILERLVTQSQRVLLILNVHDLDLIGQYVQPALQPFDAAQARGYGLYVVEANTAVHKPDFVFASQNNLAKPPQHFVYANFENKFDLWGFDVEDKDYHAGDVVQVIVYWRPRQPMQFVYTGFAHLLGNTNPTSGNSVWAQDDHDLGRGLYRTLVWLPGEVIQEQYALTIPLNTPEGAYVIEVGAYDPLQVRLKVFDNNGNVLDDKVVLGEVKVTK